jgi:hypothetical protein
VSQQAKYDETIDRITEGATVAYRGTGEIIGQVDELAEGDGSRWALVSWPAEDMPHARTDERGRRGQVFNLATLMVVEDDYDAINDPPEPGEDQVEEEDEHASVNADLVGYFDPDDCGGVWDGFQVTSDADSGL